MIRKDKTLRKFFAEGRNIKINTQKMKDKTRLEDRRRDRNRG